MEASKKAAAHPATLWLGILGALALPVVERYVTQIETPASVPQEYVTQLSEQTSGIYEEVRELRSEVSRLRELVAAHQVAIEFLTAGQRERARAAMAAP